MTTDNSKHRLANKTGQRRQYFRFLVESIDAMSGVCTISPDVTTKSRARLFVHLQMLKCLPISQSILHTAC